ncbi:retrovirus-related pol polyprotein from transposon TNT 1-94 [Tanacetum coccineum]
MYLTRFLNLCVVTPRQGGNTRRDGGLIVTAQQKWVKDETIYKEWEDRIKRVATTASSLEAECQDTILGGAEAQIRFKAASKQPNVHLSRVNILGSGEDTMKLMELMEHCTTLSELFWTSAKVKTVNEERHIQALVDKKKVIISETSIRSDLKLDDAEGTDCLPTATIFAELERMGYENLTQKLTFYKAYFLSQWKFLIHTILQCLSSKTTSWNEFSSTMASAIICLATNQKFNLSKYIFDNMVKNLDGGVKFLMYPRFVQVFLDKQVEGMSKHKGVYVTPSHTKKVFANMKRPCEGFSGRVTPLFSTMMVQATEDMGADSATPTDSHSTPIITQPSSSKPQKKKSSRKQRKDSAPTEPTTEETTPEEHVATPSCDPPQSGKDRMQLTELMNLCTQLQSRVLALETTKSNQALEIESLKRRVKQLEKRRKSRTSGLRRLRKVSSSSRVESFNDASLAAQEDASKQGRKITNLDADAEVNLVDKTQEMNDDNLMFDTSVLEEQEIEFEKVVEEPIVSVATTTKSIPVSAAKVVTTASASVEIPDELTLAQTLIEIKTAKPKPITTAATTVTSVRPRAKGIIFHDQEEQVPASTKTFSSSQSQLPQVKDKGKGKMVEPEVPLKKKDQVALDEEMARNLEAQLQAELIEEERLARQKEEEANIALIESWDNTQAMMEADFELAQRLQAEEQGEITIEERSRLFVELMNRRKKHFAKLRAEEIRRKPPTKAQKRNQMSTYLKNMAGYKHSQLKSKSYDEIQKLFDKEMKRVNTFVDMNSEVVKGSETRTKESSKRAGDELESDMDQQYGLKQAPRAWYDELSNFLASKGFSKGSIDPTLFITKKWEDILLVQIYVDDIIFSFTNPKLSKRFEKLMHIKFEMSMMGELKFFLGIQIHQSAHGTFINQAKYAQEILNKHGMTSCDSIGTPMATKHLDADLSGTPIDQTKYRSMVRALMYLTTSRPNIVHATCYYARYQAKPTEKHLTTVKRIFRYLKNTINMGVWYPKDTGFELTAFLDSDHAGCLDLPKAEYVSLSACCAQVIWLRTQLTDYGFHFDKNTYVEKGIVELFFVGTEYQLANLFTKALPEDRFKYLVRRLGMRCLTPEELEVLENESA